MGAGRLMAARESDDGFSLIELVVAMVIIAIVLTSLAVVQTRAMVTIAQAKERQQATAIANQTLEQLRALPWDTLKKGLSSAYPASTDPNVSSGRLRPPATPAINEALIVSTDQAINGTATPLSTTGGSNVQSISDPETPGRVFTVRSYVTEGAYGVNGPRNLTVIVSWVRRGDGQARTVIARSAAYAPSGGCGGTENQPFLGACQAFFTAEAGSTGVSITISAAQFVEEAASPDPTDVGPWTILDGMAEDEVAASLTSIGGSVTSEQATTAKARAVLGGLQTAAGGTVLFGSGMTAVDLVASDEVSTSYPLNPSPITSMGSAVTRTLTGTNGQFTITVPSGMSSQVRSGMTAGCSTPGAGIACSRSDATGSGALEARFTVGPAETVLASVSGSTSAAWSGRFITTAGVATTGCTALSDTGCNSSFASQSAGTTVIGGGPAWDGGGAPSGLVRITSYATSVRSEYGAGQLNVTPTATRSGSVQWWNGSSYQTFALGPTTNVTQTIGPIIRSGGGATVRAIGTLSVLPATVARSNADPLCRAEGCSLEASVPPITISMTYFVEVGAERTAFTVVTSLGGPRSASSYKAAPIG